MTTPTKRSVGRPRKNAKKQENPDCELASKGFVKCVARKLGEHTHTNTAIAMVFYPLLGLFAMIAFLVMYGNSRSGDVFPQVSIPTILVTCAVIGVCGSVGGMIEGFKTDASKDLGELQTIQKHEEPTCEPKRGCEGE